MILLNYAKLSCGVDKTDLANTVKQLFSHPDNQIYIDKICNRAHDASTCESLAALILLAKLCQHMKLQTHTLVLKRAESGKPYFDGSEFNFNITHSQGRIAVALSDSGKVGIDLEAKDIDVERAYKLSARYLSESNQKAVTSTSDFLKVWTEKEAIAKLCDLPLTTVLSSEVPDSINIRHEMILNSPVAICFYDEQALTILPQQDL